MSNLTFKIVRDYWDCGNLYRNKEVTIQDGLTVLVGCNGSGKTTLTYQIKSGCKEQGIRCVNFDNVENGGSRNYYGLLNNWFGSGSLDTLRSMVGSSEGEKISQNMMIFANRIKDAVEKSKAEGKTDMVVTYDAVDSGASIDTIIDLKDFFRTLTQHHLDKDNINVHVVTVANSYEMANGENCLDVYTGEYRTFSDYEDYKKFILSTRKRKDRRYECANKRHERERIREEEKRKKEEERIKNGHGETEGGLAKRDRGCLSWKRN